MSQPAEKIPFQDDIITAMEGEGKRSKDPHGSICLMHMVLTYFAVQCASRALPTRKMAREAMKREIDNAFDFLDKQKVDEADNEQRN